MDVRKDTDADQLSAIRPWSNNGTGKNIPVLDLAQPHKTISDWFAGHSECELIEILPGSLNAT